MPYSCLPHELAVLPYPDRCAPEGQSSLTYNVISLPLESPVNGCNYQQPFRHLTAGGQRLDSVPAVAAVLRASWPGGFKTGLPRACAALLDLHTAFKTSLRAFRQLQRPARVPCKMARALLSLLFAALLLVASATAAKLPSNPNERRQALRQRCYERCMKKYGWKPVCVYSPSHPEPTSHMPTAKARQGAVVSAGGHSEAVLLDTCLADTSVPSPSCPLQWVMPNKCTMGCQAKYAKYSEYFNLKVDKHTKGEQQGGRLVCCWAGLGRCLCGCRSL
jgi:hypothetical protein